MHGVDKADARNRITDTSHVSVSAADIDTLALLGNEPSLNNHQKNMNRLMLIGALMLAGCASPAVFRDPKTGQVAQCNATTPGTFPLIAQHEIDDCAAAYVRMGWQKQ